MKPLIYHFVTCQIIERTSTQFYFLRAVITIGSEAKSPNVRPRLAPTTNATVTRNQSNSLPLPLFHRPQQDGCTRPLPETSPLDYIPDTDGIVHDVQASTSGQGTCMCLYL